MTKAPVKVQKMKTDPTMTNEDSQDNNLSLYPVKDASVATSATINTSTKVRDVDTVKLRLKESNLITDEDLLLNIPRRSILRTSTTSTSDESGSFKPREVSFDSIRIRNYGMELGNHPNCQIGAPVTLSWDYEEQGTQDIDVYEFERKPRRRMKHLILNYYRRNDILKLAGYSDKELKAAEKAVAQVQRQRQTTATFLPVRQLGELIGSTARRVTRVGRRNSSSE
jgi:hypothetical protein